MKNNKNKKKKKKMLIIKMQKKVGAKGLKSEFLFFD